MRGSVSRRGDGWTVRFDVGVDPATGRRVQKRRTFRTRKEAERALATFLRDAEAGVWEEPSDQPLSQYLEEWLTAVEPTLRNSTWNEYKGKLRRHVIPHCGGLPLRKVDATTLTALYAKLATTGGRRGDGLSARSVRHVHKILHRALRDAVRWRRLTSNPADHADPPRVEEPEMSVWSPEQLRRFLDLVSGDRLEACWALVATTGLRRGEIAGLRWCDVDLNRHELVIRHTRVAVGYDIQVGPPKSRRSRRPVALDAETAALLRSHRTNALEERMALGLGWDETQIVFMRPDGAPYHPQSITYYFQQAARKAGLPAIRLHDLRHSYATAALQAGVHPKIVSERLGHSSVSMTLDVYSHVIEGMQEEAAQVVADVIRGRSTGA